MRPPGTSIVLRVRSLSRRGAPGRGASTAMTVLPVPRTLVRWQADRDGAGAGPGMVPAGPTVRHGGPAASGAAGHLLSPAGRGWR